MPRVFISHSAQDREQVERELIFPLRARGVETWYSTDSIKSASEWERQIRAGLKACDWFLVALSPRSVASEWVSREVHWAFLKREGRIIPVMLETCELDELHLGLLPIQFIDFRNDPAWARERLLSIWGLDNATRANSLYRAAQEALARKDWDAAVGHLEEVFRIDPGRSQVEAELTRARRLRGLAPLYEAGLAHLREGRWRDALASLRQVQAAEGEYKDVDGLLAQADAGLRKDEAERLYQEAVGASGREEWDTAVERLEAALKLDPSHTEARGALVRAAQQKELAEAYAAGREHLQAGRWRDALKSFRKVRAIDKGYKGVADFMAEAYEGLEEEEVHRPEKERRQREAAEEAERQARQEREKLLRESLDALNRKDWGAARERLQAAAAAGAGDEEIAERLADIDRQEHLATLYERGLRHSEDGNWAEALNAFRQVREAGGDYEDASARLERAEAELKRLREKRERERPERQAAEQLEARRKSLGLGSAGGAAETRGPVVERGSLLKIIPVPAVAVMLFVLGLALWPKKDPPAGGNANANADAPAAQVAASGADAFNRAEALRKQAKYAEAEAEYRKALAAEPNNADYHNGLADALDSQHKYQEAEAEARKAIELNPAKAAYHNTLGGVLFALDRLEEAEAEVRKAVEIEPDTPDYHMNIARTLLNRGRGQEAGPELRKAEAGYRKVIASNPDDDEARSGLGSALFYLGKFKEAEAQLRKARDLNPNKAEYHNNLGFALTILNKHKEAEAELGKAIELDPVAPAPRRGLAVLLAIRGKYQEAVAELRKATELDPNNADYHNELGSMLYEMSKYEEAEAAARRAIELDPDNAGHHENLANALARQGRKQEAAAERRMAKELKSKSR